MKQNLIYKTWAFLCTLALVLSLSSAAYAESAAPANGGIITGFVSSPGSYPLPVGTVVKLFSSDELNIHGQAFPDVNTGSFTIGPVANGLYLLKAIPPAASLYTQSTPIIVSIANAPADVGEVSLTNPQVTGTVFNPTGTIPTPAEVLVLLGDGRVAQHIDAPTGQYRIGGLLAGSYFLVALPAGNLPLWRSHKQSLSIVNAGPLQTIDLNLTPAQTWGTAHDSLGNPLPLAYVYMEDSSGNRVGDFTNRDGFWAIGGLPAGTFTLTAIPPYNRGGLLPPPPQSVSLPGAFNPYTLVFPNAPKQVTGSVLTNTNLPVENALIVARRLDRPGSAEALSGQDGAYQVGLAPGLWSLTVGHTPDTQPSAWIYPLAPQLVHFDDDLEPESKIQDFQVLTADANVSGVVVMPDGSPPPFTVTVGLFNNDGVGRRTEINTLDGSFIIQLPNGNYKVAVHADDAGYLGPVVEPVNLPENGNLDLGVLTLLPRDAIISGQLTTASGTPAGGISLVAWRPGIPGALRTNSTPDGTYALAVSAGEWHIQPSPTASQPYLYSGPGQDISLIAGQVATGINFEMLATDAVIQGNLIDESGASAELAQGWAAAWQTSTPEIHNGAPIESGHFTIHIPAGEYRLAAILPPGSPYLSTTELKVSVASGETAQVTLTVKTHNANIQGALWDPRNEDVVEGVAGSVSAWTQGAWSAAPINTDNGVYHLAASAGIWRLNFRIDPRQGYAKINSPINIPLTLGQTATVPLRILYKDSLLTGSVIDPDGNPLAGATVLVKGVGGMVDDLWLQTTSAADGSFTLALPYGRYRLGAAGNYPEWIKPVEYHVTIAPNSTSIGHELQFRLPDITISGTITIPGATSDGFVYLWAWEQNGGFIQKHIPVTSDGINATGSYSIGSLSNTTWRLGTAFETETQFWAVRMEMTTGSEDLVQDLVLNGPFNKPAPAVVTFDASQPQHIRLADGTFIYIPAGAMPVVGMVTLRIVPIATLPNQQHANILRYGYAFLATDANGESIEAHFNQDVIISFTYDEAEVQHLNIFEPLIKPAYFSTTTNRWTFPESYVVDTDTNRITIQIDHFTDYALTGVTSHILYLPLIRQ